MNHAPCWLCDRHHQVSGARVALRGLAAGGLTVLAYCGSALADPASEPLPAERAAAVLSAQRGSTSGMTRELNAEDVRLVPSGSGLLAPDGTAIQRLAAIDVRWRLQRGPASLRWGIGTLVPLHPASDVLLQPDGAPPLPLASTLSVGMSVRMTGQSALYADASGAMGLSNEPGLGYMRTKVGLEWKPAKSRLGLDEGRVGIQFDSGYRLSLRLRRGGVGVYLRGQF
jgi:hypothetical protein